jgi:hypothetical protein
LLQTRPGEKKFSWNKLYVWTLFQNICTTVTVQLILTLLLIFYYPFLHQKPQQRCRFLNKRCFKLRADMQPSIVHLYQPTCATLSSP